LSASVTGTTAFRSVGSDVDEHEQSVSACVLSRAAFSPDGKRIAFISNRDNLGNSTSDWEVHVTDAADGANLIRLTFDLTADFDPAFRP
jgi:Tol biopolymer transport system component